MSTRFRDETIPNGARHKNYFWFSFTLTSRARSCRMRQKMRHVIKVLITFDQFMQLTVCFGGKLTLGPLQAGHSVRSWPFQKICSGAWNFSVFSETLFNTSLMINPTLRDIYDHFYHVFQDVKGYCFC